MSFDIPAEYWWLTIVLAGVAFLGKWFFNRYLPARVEREKELWLAEREDEQDFKLQERKNKDATLALARETIDWSRKEFSDMQEEVSEGRKDIKVLITTTRNIVNNLTIQAGIIKELKDKNDTVN